MKQLIENFPQQLETAIQIGKSAKLSFRIQAFTQVSISGLGGSGIGASIVQDYMFDKATIPFVINKHYFIPKNVNDTTLFIACSYSGNTEETLNAVKLAHKQNANIVCITSGGELASFAKKHKLNLILIPGGNPPRACLGYSLVQILFVLKKVKLIKANITNEISDSIKWIISSRKSIQNIALKISQKLINKQVAIYTTVGHEGLAIRFRQQLNENSKILAWHNIIPEMTHNEIVGWRHSNESVATICCHFEDDYDINITRLKVLKNVIKNYNTNITDLNIKGKNYWEQAFYFIHLTDWISVYLADANGHDTAEVKVIDHLKETMSKK